MLLKKEINRSDYNYLSMINVKKEMGEIVQNVKIIILWTLIMENANKDMFKIFLLKQESGNQ